MIYEIKNDVLRILVNTAGGSLWSILDCEGTQYLWQGDKAHWTDRAPNLFPYIARLTERKYTLFDDTYEMNIHGFVKYSELELAEQGDDFLRMILKANENTKAQYPYDFDYEITYRLIAKCLEITYRVTNHDSKSMYFAVGGHPGFNVPMEQGIEFTDYVIEFPYECTPKKVVMSNDCFVTGEDVDFPLQDGRILTLKHYLFDDDAIILKNMPREVILKSARGQRGIRVTYPQMQYLGLWHRPKTDAPYLCIEPWTSLPSRKSVVEDLATQPDLISLAPEQVYNNTWTIEIL